MEMVKTIVASQEIGTQVELIEELRRSGISSTQATLSRDLKVLGIAKALNGNGHYVYMLPESRVFRGVSQTHATMRALHNIGVLTMRFSGNIAVISTLPGYASHVAYDIDNAQIDCVLGTVAGDDTVIAVLEEGTPASHALNAIAAVTNFNAEDLAPSE